eukprot:TRINITY_DN2969_c2_g15_i1.p1 TRINITY_DN2969_c2_g15~~TRINITY_DN2969_c2_g15_i1.p1  ORF type:complete len:110 (+),score=52.84 TRINITY_DN2969_c2_g15_i1:29-358(+)
MKGQVEVLETKPLTNDEALAFLNTFLDGQENLMSMSNVALLNESVLTNLDQLSRALKYGDSNDANESDIDQTNASENEDFEDNNESDNELSHDTEDASESEEESEVESD